MIKSKLIQFRIDYILSNNVCKFCYITGKNERNAITNALVNKIDKKENAEIKSLRITRV